MNANKINKGQKKDKNQEKLIINSLTDLLNISLNEINIDFFILMNHQKTSYTLIYLLNFIYFNILI